MANKIYFSDYHAGYIAGMQDMLGMMTEVFLGKATFTRRTFFAAIVQAGISRLLLSKNLTEEFADVPFVQTRLDTISVDELKSDYELISDVFKNHLPDDYRTNQAYQDVVNLEIFLADLFTALRLNVDLMFPGEPPRALSMEGLLPPDLAVPVKNLLQTVQTCSIPGLVPQLHIEKRGIAVFRELIESIWFEDFCVAHQTLDDSSVALEAAIPMLRDKATFVIKNCDSQIDLCNLPALLLPLAPDIVDKAVGKFPGKLAEHFSKLVHPYLKKKRRIVIYDSSPINNRIIMSTMLHVSQNRDPEDPEDMIIKRMHEYAEEHPEFKKYLEKQGPKGANNFLKGIGLACRDLER